MSTATRSKPSGRGSSSRAERDRRKQRVLSHATPSITGSIAQAVVAKEGPLYFLCRSDGDVPLDEDHGYGLYLHDCRFLDGYRVRVADCALGSLVASAARGYMATIELSNPDLHLPDDTLVPKETLGVRWEHVVDGQHFALHDCLTITNYGDAALSLPITLEFSARFEDLFVVRGMLPDQTGTHHPPRWSDGVLEMNYDGIDGIHRGVRIAFDPPPASTSGATASFSVGIDSRESRSLRVSISLVESSGDGPHDAERAERIDVASVVRQLESASDQWLARLTNVESDSVMLGRLLDRSTRDLNMLRTPLDGDDFFAAGIPWFVTLFGRDSVITALQSLAFDRSIAEQTLRLLAKYQATTTDAWRDAEPGRILHELRVGELTRAGKVPYSPYYGTVDATPLFLILLGRHAAWTGELVLFEELRDHVDAALTWIDQLADTNGDGYVDYRSKSSDGLINQGWKDSGDAIVDEHGDLATPPIGLVEVQGYVYLAKRLIADLLRRSGAVARANALEREAADLRERFNRDFWLDDIDCYALALQRDMVPAAVVSSNPGHALWTGIADVHKAKRTMERLMQPDMFSGWGIRTLSSTEQRYNPISYHLGTVWPHDNAIIAAGFRRYGFDDAAERLFAGITAAAMEFEHDRLPELFGGFARDDFGVPVRYPVADHPQAWGAGSIPYLLVTMLGLTPEAFERRLRIVRPRLPEHVDRLEMRRLRVGPGLVDLRFRRRADNSADVEVLSTTDGIEVALDDSLPDPHAAR